MAFVDLSNLSGEDIALIDEIIEERQDAGPDDTTYDSIQKLATIADISTVRTSYNVDSDRDIINGVISALSGTEINVAYYQRLKDSILAQTSRQDIAKSIDPLDIDLVCIHNFKIRLSSVFEYTYDSESNISGISGVGVTYPGFQPTKGDSFLYPIDVNQIGVFKLTNATRMSVSKQTVFSINFMLHRFATGEDIDNLQRSVVKELYFDKDMFLSGSNNMLETSEYKSFETAKTLVKKLTTYYFNKFYDPHLRTIVRMDAVFDPYVVEFLHKFMSTNECGHRPRRYMPIENYYNTIWGIFDNDVDIELENMQHWMYLEQHMYSPHDVDINNLIERIYIRHRPLCPYGFDDAGASSVPSCQKHHTTTGVEEISVTCSSELYIFSKDFYESTGSPIIIDPCCYLADTEQCIGSADIVVDPILTTMETLIKAYMNDTIVYEDVVTYAKTYGTLYDSEQFYQIPMLIYLLKEYIFKLTN